MSLRVVSVTGPALLRYTDLHLIVLRNGEQIGRVPVEDMASLVLDGPDLLVSHQLLSACADHNVVVLTADEKHMPNGLLLPLTGHTVHTETLWSQIEASVPNQKRVWQCLVKAKVRTQAMVVAKAGKDDTSLRRLVPLVRSGDPDNIEATAAALYFETLFGPLFTRNREAPGLNACLNYGYAVVRSAVARALVGAGLEPALGVHHHNRYNAFCLADDAMEPYRSVVDYSVWQMASNGHVPDELDPGTKRLLVSVLGRKLIVAAKPFPFLVGLERFAACLRRAICEGDRLEVPLPLFSDE